MTVFCFLLTVMWNCWFLRATGHSIWVQSSNVEGVWRLDLIIGLSIATDDYPLLYPVLWSNTCSWIWAQNPLTQGSFNLWTMCSNYWSYTLYNLYPAHALYIFGLNISYSDEKDWAWHKNVTALQLFFYIHKTKRKKVHGNPNNSPAQHLTHGVINQRVRYDG